MNPKFRALYLVLGAAGLILLGYYTIKSFPEINPGMILLITVPTMLFFFLAYKTYPIIEEPRSQYSHVRRSLNK